MKSKKATPKLKKKNKGGAPKGNRNARQHGLFAKNNIVTEGEIKNAQSRMIIADEVIDLLFTKLHQVDSIEDICRCANSISMAIAAANGCERTIAIVSGKVSALTEAIEQVLANNDPYDPSTIE